MSSESTTRPEFRIWIDSKPKPNWQLLPLTHIAKGLIAGDIVRDGRIAPGQTDEVLGEAVSFFFYGRPAYRVHGDGAIKSAAACPFLFIFDPAVIERAHSIHAFDTGAYGRRMYSHVLMEEMRVGDFSLEQNSDRPNKLISTTFGSLDSYLDADSSKIPHIDTITNPDDFLARAYIELLQSKGRNEPDDRVGTIEVTFLDPLPLRESLRAVVVPDILWNDKHESGWLKQLSDSGVEIIPFRFITGRSPEYYMQNLEVEAKKHYLAGGFL